MTTRAAVTEPKLDAVLRPGRRLRVSLIVTAAVAVTLALAAISMGLGAADLSWSDLTNADGRDRMAMILSVSRLPRTAGGEFDAGS